MTTTLGPTDQQIETMRDHVMTSIAMSERKTLASTVRGREKRRKFVWLAVASGITAAALVVVGVTWPLGSGGASAQAAEALHDAATLTVLTADPIVGPGEYLKIETSESYSTTGMNADGDFVSWLAPSTRALYVPGTQSDDWVLERYRLEPTTFFGDGAQELAMKDWAINRVDKLTNGIFRAPEGFAFAATLADTSAMPHDPQKLYDYFVATDRGGSNSVEENVWVRITDLLRTGTVPADLRAALYGAASLVPGVEIIPGGATVDGQMGIVLGRVESSRTTRQDIIIDPTNGLLLGERMVLSAERSGAPAGTIISATSVRTSIVDSAP